MRTAFALAALAVATLAGCSNETGMNEEVLDRLLDQQASTQEALDTAVKALVTATKAGPVRVEKIPVDGGTVIFALWPNGNQEVWAVADDGRTVSLAYERDDSYKHISEEGVSWMRR